MKGMATMTAFWSALGIVAGMLIALQGPINAQLARGLGMPVAAAAASFLAGTVVLVVITLVPKLGAAATMAFIVSGQLLAGLLLDRLGYFDLAVRELTLGRVAGACLLVVGALLISVN
jgi:transporter family-2 protein